MEVTAFRGRASHPPSSSLELGGLFEALVSGGFLLFEAVQEVNPFSHAQQEHLAVHSGAGLFLSHFIGSGRCKSKQLARITGCP